MKLFIYIAFTLLLMPLTASAQAERAYAATTLSEARAGFESMYGFRATDCDPINNEWVCSEFNVSASTLLSLPEPTAEPTADSGVCIAYGSSIQDAQTAFSADCPWRVRQSCDLLSSGEWACTTAGAPASSTQPTASNDSSSQQGSCIAYGSSIDAAQESFSAVCPWRDRNYCNPVSDGQWACSTEVIETSTNVLDSSTDNTDTTSTADASSNNDADTTTSSSNGYVLQIEAEDVAYNSARWSPSEGGLVYTGANRYLLTSRNDDANLVFNFSVPVAGTYRFTMRSRAGNGNDPSEPPNDVWLKAPGQQWLKVYMTRDGSWHVDAIGELNGTHSRELNTYEFSAGQQQLIVSGRSQGHILDWVALEPQGFTIDETTTASAPPPPPITGLGTGVMNTTYQPGDLVVIAHDSGPDTDDMQAIVANRMIMDANASVEFILVGATQGHAWTNPTAGSEAHTQSLFPDWINAKASTSGTTSFDGTSVITVADRIAATLHNAGTVHIAEGGPSDFTAEVLRLLQSRGVSASDLKRVRVVQHSAGSTAWNEQQTSSSNIALVKSAATWVPIANGNVGGNATADFQEPASSAMCQRYRSAAAGTQYASQWAWAYSTIGDARKCDQSDSVELLYILNDTSTKTFDQFVSRYM